MEIAVCVNQIPDPEAPPEKFRYTPGALAPEPWTGPFVVGPFDENALELALRLKATAQATVHAISVGDKRAVAALRKALAVQVDDASRVVADPDALDTSGVATLLAAAIQRFPDVRVVLCGRQSGDWDAAQLGPLLAERLGFACANLVRRIEEVDGDALVVVRERDAAQERARVTLPAVLVVTNDPQNQLRVAKVKDIMLGERKPIVEILAADLGGVPPRVLETVALRRPPARDTKVELVTGATVEEQAVALAKKLVALAHFS